MMDTANAAGLVAGAGLDTATQDGADTTDAFAPLNVTLTDRGGGAAPPPTAMNASVPGVACNARSEAATW